MPEKYSVKVITASGIESQGEIEAWEESPSDEDAVMVKLSLSEEVMEGTADDFFTALVEIRKELEKSGRLMVNYGSSLNVYPSSMSRNMGAGEKAYKLTPGQQAKSADLVSVFEVGPDVIPSRIADQERFFEEWLQSLKK